MLGILKIDLQVLTLLMFEDMKEKKQIKKKWEKPTLKSLSFRNTYGGAVTSVEDAPDYHS